MFEATLKNMEQTEALTLKSSGVSPALLNELAPTVVKLYCKENSHSDSILKGPGFLYRASRNYTRSPFYYVQTNLHVIQMEDRPPSTCRILVFPDASGAESYLLYKSEGYKSYGTDIDIAFLEPEFVVNNLKGETWNDLVAYARDESRNPICDTVDIEDHLSILGCPGVRGETLTVTEGIVSGFELGGKNRYVKTSAKTDHGNSSPHFSPEREARARRCPEILGFDWAQPSGARETKRAGVLYSTSSPLSELNAVDSGRCSPTAVGW